MAAPAGVANAGATSLAIDANALGSLKAAAARTPEKAVKLAAREFEALFLNQVLKSMRESLPKDGPFASAATESYTQMFDRELSKSMAARGTGLAAMIEKQLQRTMAPAAAAPQAGKAAPAAGAKAPLSLKAQAAATAYSPRFAPKATQMPAPARDPAAPAARKAATTEDQRSFLSKVMEFAQAPAAAIGLSPVFVAAQAALESGWGRHEIRHADGTPAHNLFGVKAGSGWTGATVDVATTEYENGAPVRKVEKFRAYPSYAEGLADYVQLLAGNARYRNVVANGQDAQGFARALARSGYATDPAYGSKIASLIEKAKSLTGPG